MGRQRAFKEAKEFGEKPATTEYTNVCKLCQLGRVLRQEDGGTPQASSAGPIGWGSTASGEQDSLMPEPTAFGGDPWYLAPGACTLQAAPTDLI